MSIILLSVQNSVLGKKNGCERKASSILHPKMTPGSILNTVHNIRFQLQENTFNWLRELLVYATTDMHIIVVKIINIVIYHPLKKIFKSRTKSYLLWAISQSCSNVKQIFSGKWFSTTC